MQELSLLAAGPAGHILSYKCLSLLLVFDIFVILRQYKKLALS